MKELLDAFWRAAAYCLHPKIIGLSLMPLLLGGVLAFGLGWMYWESAVAGMRALLEGWALVDSALRWVDTMLGGAFRAVLAPLLVVLLAVPLIVVVSLLLVAWTMSAAVVDLVAARRFPLLERRRGGGLWLSIGWSALCTVLALLALVASLPLWFIPPLVLLVPPLIWGWLTYRVMAFDALADHANGDERRTLMRRHRLALLAMGVVTGYLGAAPTLLWAFSAATLVFAPFLIVVSVWLYTLIFAFSMLWFAHFALAALAALRAEAARVAPAPAAAAPPAPHGPDAPPALPATGLYPPESPPALPRNDPSP